ncbi:unnamed protein product [Lymnaea stagnalis]|uniref:Tight junction protein ZO-1 n=1 Tax=Lymnaea stagnalis TaxID=6523 RepID=A0AAV2IR60_LYMST
MAGKSGIARLLERVRPIFLKELDINKLLPRLLSRGLFSVSEEKEILSPLNPKKRIDILLDILSSKDRVAFAEFCKSLEECAPHLLTSLVLENQQGQDFATEDNPPTQALQLGFELALKERDAVLRENARAQEERDDALRKLETLRTERDQALASLETIATKQGKLKDGMSSLERISRTDSKKMKDTPVVVETDQAYEELRFSSTTSPLNNQNGPNVVWETHQVTLHKAPTFGFGIAVSGGRDTPHFANGDPSVAISDVLKAGPAEGRLQINDRIMTVNGISLENVDHAVAINVLRDCGNTVNLVVRRRILLPVSQTERLTPPFKITLSKKTKKDDFGIVLGCKLYIKEIIPHSLAAHEHTLREGDTVLKINNTPVENISLADARKLVDKSKDKLQLIVSKDRRSDDRGSIIPVVVPTTGAAGSDTEVFPPRVHDKDDVNVYRPSVRSEEDIYVKDPTSSIRHAVPAGAYPNSENTRFDGHYVLDNDPPARLPLTRSMENNISDQHQKEADIFRSGRRDVPDGYYSDQEEVWRNRQDFPNQERVGDYVDDVFPPNVSIHDLDPRRVSFLKDKQTGLGLRLAGGNATGIFIASVQPGSAGEREGLVEGDQIILANDKEITGLTREEAVSYLTSLVGEVTMVVQYKKEEYDRIMASHEAGDSFHIRVHFVHNATDAATEHSFKTGDLFHVKDTLFRGIGGSWLAVKISEDPGENKKGTIPNSKTAEILKAQQGDDNNKENFPNRGRGSLFKRKSSSRRSKSLGKDHWDEVIFAGLNTKFPAYERIVFREPGFVRPVVIFGAVADIARERLLTEYPDRFDSPQVEKSTGVGDKKEKTAIIRLGSIRDAMTHRKHCLLDVTPQNVDRLNYAQYNPIVIFMKADGKQAVKDIRSRWKTSSRNPRKLLEQSEKIEKTYSHLFTSVLKHMGTDAWFPKLCEMIDAQQRQQIWMSEKQPLEDMSDDFMFPMSTRMSLAAGAESDLDIPRPRDDMDVSPIRKKQLMRSSSDPSVNTHENIPGIPPYPSPPTYKIQKVTTCLELMLLFFNKKNKIIKIDEVIHPEDRYYPSYYSDHLNSPKHYLANRSNIDPYATLTPSERLQARAQTGNLVGQNSPQHQPHPGPAGDHRVRTSSLWQSVHCFVSTMTYLILLTTQVHNDSSSHSSDSYSKYVNSPQNKHDDTKLREKFGNLQISGREKSPGHDPYRFTRSTANPVSVSVDPAKLSDLSARYRKQEGQTKVSTTKQVAPPSNQAPIKKKEPPPVPAKTISLKQRGIEPDELKMRNYENSNRAYNYADVNNASSRYGPSGTPPVPPPPSSTSYPGGLDTDRPYEYMSVRQAQNTFNNRLDGGGSSSRLDGGPRPDLSPLHHHNIPSGYNKGSAHLFQQSQASDLQRQQFYQGGRGFSMDSGLQPPPLPPHPSDQDYYDSKAYTNEVYMEHGDLQRARLTRIQPPGFSSIPQQGARDGGRELYQGVVPPALDGGYTRPRTDDEQLEDLQHSKWRAKSETRLAEVSNIYAHWNNTNSHSNLRISNVDEDMPNNKMSGGGSSGILWQGRHNNSRGRNANRYKSWDTAKHEHDMFSAYTKLITTQAFVPQKRHVSRSTMELRAENYPQKPPDSAFTSYKRLTKQASFSGTSSNNPPETNWRTGRSGERSRPVPSSAPQRSHSVGSALKKSVACPPLAPLPVIDVSALPYPPVSHTTKSAKAKLTVRPVNGDLSEAEGPEPQLPPPPVDLPFLFTIMPLPPPPPLSELFRSAQTVNSLPPTEPPPPPPPLKTFPLPPVSKEIINSKLIELKGLKAREGEEGLSESSGSKSHTDAGDKHDSVTLDEKHTIIATAKGIFTSKGGLLESQETGVSIFIPEGAIEENFEQEIYFKVCRDNSLLPPLDTEKGETLLSPLVMCGPHGIQFKKPVELRLPHCASANPESWSFALKSSDSPSGKTTEWQNMTLAGSEGVSKGRVDQSSVSILVDHF